jgi:hypothetical protein
LEIGRKIFHRKGAKVAKGRKELLGEIVHEAFDFVGEPDGMKIDEKSQMLSGHSQIRQHLG